MSGFHFASSSSILLWKEGARVVKEQLGTPQMIELERGSIYAIRR
jgi:hypothetical protein